MAIVCSSCGGWIQPEIDFAGQTAVCPQCDAVMPRRYRPLFIVTGASGAGKSTVTPLLQRQLAEWLVFEIDILQDSGGDWQTVKCNWLRIAQEVAQNDRSTLLCGTITPPNLTDCNMLPFFPAVHYLALTCDSDTLAARLRARPAWRGFDDALIDEHVRFNDWWLTQQHNPAITLLDTTDATPEETAVQITNWLQTLC